MGLSRCICEVPVEHFRVHRVCVCVFVFVGGGVLGLWVVLQRDPTSHMRYSERHADIPLC